jgi:hypothetical protein
MHLRSTDGAGRRSRRRRGLLRFRRLFAALVVAIAGLLTFPGPVSAAGSTAPGPWAFADDTTDSPPGNGRDGILLSHDELMALPTTGPGWRAIMAQIENPAGGDYVLATRDDSNKDVLAYALAGARLDDTEYKQFARDKIEHMMEAPRDEEDVLGTLRHLQTYIISADLIDLASFDAELDARFREWLADEIRFDYEGGGGGGSVISTHEKKPNNFGTHAGATRIAAALYLDDDEELQAARDVWFGWATGDPDFTPAERVWTGTDWQCDDDRPAGINPEGCERDGNSLDGVIPEDQERCGEYSWPPCDTNYIHGATDGMTLSFWMLARQGEDPWEWGDRAALRQMEWKYEVDQPPYEGFRWQIPVIEQAYDIDLEGNNPGAMSTNFGFADWWANAVLREEPGRPDDDEDGSPVPVVWIAVGSVAGVLVVAAALFWIRRRRHPVRPPAAPSP